MNVVHQKRRTKPRNRKGLEAGNPRLATGKRNYRDES